MSQLLTTKQLQQILKVDRVTVYRMLNDGRLKGVKVANQWRFEQTEIDRLLRKETVVAEDKMNGNQVTDFPTDCVQKLQEIFAGIIGVGAVTVSLEGEPLTDVYTCNPFCKLMLSNPAGRQACEASWRKTAQHVTGEPQYFTCHAGINYTRATIEMDGQPVALMIAGQFFTQPPDPEKQAHRLEDLSVRYQIPLAQLKELASKIPVIHRSQQEQLQEWAPKVAGTVQSMLCERADLMNRLQQIASLSSVQQTLPRG